MKRCPTCNRTYADLSLNFCLDDGTPLASDAAPTTDLNATIPYPSPPRDTSEPPPTEIYRPTTPEVTPRPTTPPPPRPTPPPPPPQPQTQAQQQWTPPPAVPRKRSNAIWWILGGFAAVVVIGVGLVVMIIALASLGSGSNTNISNTNSANRNVNTNTNVANTNINANTTRTGPLLDDFSEKKWGVATSQYGRTWYANDEYHMSSKERTFVVMYAPSNDYNSENATVKVTARSVDGGVPSAGFGLMVHCLQSRSGQLEDYALLIYPSADEPAYEVIMHKQGNQSTLVPRTKSDAIKSGAEPNELQIKINGSQMVFYANDRILTTLTDRENYRRGRVGFYTSDVFEVAFDNLRIERTQ